MLLAQDPVAFFFRSDCRKPPGPDSAPCSESSLDLYCELENLFLNFDDSRSLLPPPCPKARFSDLLLDLDLDAGPGSNSAPGCFRRRSRLCEAAAWSWGGMPAPRSLPRSIELLLVALGFFFFTLAGEMPAASARLSVRLLELDGFERQTEELPVERLPRLFSEVALDDADSSLLGPPLSVAPLPAPELLPLLIKEIRKVNCSLVLMISNCWTKYRNLYAGASRSIKCHFQAIKIEIINRVVFCGSSVFTNTDWVRRKLKPGDKCCFFSYQA